MKHVLCNIISCEQTGFLKGRYIGENVRLVLDMIDYCNYSEEQAALIFLDFEKAFDSIAHSFIDNVLYHFNFGSSFRKWVNVLYSNASSCVINNGNYTNFFPVLRGVRQGCPLSPYLFILCTEIFCLHIKHSNNIKGITIKGKEVKISQFADDTVLFIDGSYESVTNVQVALSNFENISGLVINYDKSLLFPIGSLRENTFQLLQNSSFVTSNGPIKYLGISFTHRKDDFFKLNYLPKLSRLKNVLNLWSMRDLTPIGKITIIKSFALSQLVYLFTVLPNPPNYFMVELQRTLYNFIWSSKNHKVKHLSLINDYEGGGLRMLHIESFINSLKCSWVRRYCSTDTSTWKIFFDLALRQYGGIFLFNCNMSPSDFSNMENVFIKNVCEAWFKYSFMSPTDHFDNQIFLNNSFIKIENNVFFSREIVNANAYHVRNLFTITGVIKDFISYTEYNIRSLPFTVYHGLISALPLHWKHFIKNNGLEDITPNPNEIKIAVFKVNMSNSKNIYSSLRNNVAETPTCVYKWKRDFSDDLNFTRIFLLPFKALRNSKIQYFPFRFLHRILGINSFLFRIGLTDSPRCSFCADCEETLSHLFWDCSIINKF